MVEEMERLEIEPRYVLYAECHRAAAEYHDAIYSAMGLHPTRYMWAQADAMATSGDRVRRVFVSLCCGFVSAASRQYPQDVPHGLTLHAATIANAIALDPDIIWVETSGKLADADREDTRLALEMILTEDTGFEWRRFVIDPARHFGWPQMRCRVLYCALRKSRAGWPSTQRLQEQLDAVAKDVQLRTEDAGKRQVRVEQRASQQTPGGERQEEAARDKERSATDEARKLWRQQMYEWGTKWAIEDFKTAGSYKLLAPTWEQGEMKEVKIDGVMVASHLPVKDEVTFARHCPYVSRPAAARWAKVSDMEEPTLLASSAHWEEDLSWQKRRERYAIRQAGLGQVVTDAMVLRGAGGMGDHRYPICESDTWEELAGQRTALEEAEKAKANNRPAAVRKAMAEIRRALDGRSGQGSGKGVPDKAAKGGEGGASSIMGGVVRVVREL